MKKTRTTYARNCMGIKVKKCCASCQHKCVRKDGSRLCALTMKKVYPYSKCPKWEMMEKLQNVGIGNGYVKDKEYLKYALKIRVEELEAIEKGEMKKDEQLSVSTLRKRFGYNRKESIFIEM